MQIDLIPRVVRFEDSGEPALIGLGGSPGSSCARAINMVFLTGSKPFWPKRQLRDLEELASPAPLLVYPCIRKISRWL